MNGLERQCHGFRAGGRAACGVVGALVLLLAVAGSAAAAPSGWITMTAVNELGATSSDNTELFTFDGRLFAYNDNGLFRMQLSPCLSWEKLYVPTPAGDWTFTPLGTTLYLHRPASGLYMISAGTAFSAHAWKAVTSSGIRGISVPLPLIVFGGQMYAVVYPPGGDTFDIWRSPHVGSTTVTWTRVVQSGFNDPQNHALGFLTIYDGNLIATTTSTRDSLFGDSSGFLQGIEVWASASGNAGTWTQINADGFGTQITKVGSTTSFRTNMDVGGHAVYKGALYVGTKSHYGAEVWKYTGRGVGGWTDVTPSWAGPSPLVSMPGRNNALIVYGGELYLAEGFSTGNLAKLSGGTWSTVVSGPNPFRSDNGGIASLAVLDGRLYASTLHAPYSGTTIGDQVLSLIHI